MPACRAPVAACPARPDFAGTEYGTGASPGRIAWFLGSTNALQQVACACSGAASRYTVVYIPMTA